MRRKRPEPKQLRDGKAFHRAKEGEWEDRAEGSVSVEKPVTKPSGRRGRIDVHVMAGLCLRRNGSDEEAPLVACVEIKNSVWDAMAEGRIKPNIQRMARQLRDYIESQLAEGQDVSPGVVFPQRPSDPARLRQIESEFAEYGIAVAWEDETVQERKARASDGDD
jgi:hypothetical protein